ncbi:RNA methyltransferase [Maribacter algarum]|uniref:tRNA (guanosine(18)-2'-O)-methyltransferase n=1 Tax=Maribacter algarum (ex Zhang et al. 2020) TaxID=2578118 RepID=A0A5S3PMM3_9FLAO|nr:RNA methyltransferase [Maribacter algarum]TMM53666.1 RNA methyltransferase [Maribacter algarum]
MIDQQLLAYLEGFISEERKERFLEVLEERTKYITVAIEDVYQKHNTSAVIRSCEVFGIQEAHVIENKNAKILDKEIAMGAEKWVDVYSYPNSGSCIETLRKQGYKIIATTPHADDCLLPDFKIDGRAALFFGTEKDGLSESVLKQADGFLKIGMHGFTESLNISVSAAIILQQLVTKLRKTDIDWGLTPAEKLEKRLDWSKKSIKSINDILTRYEASE